MFIIPSLQQANHMHHTYTSQIQIIYHTVHNTTKQRKLVQTLASSTVNCRISAPLLKQESSAVADKPARRESMPKIAQIWRENKLQAS